MFGPVLWHLREPRVAQGLAAPADALLKMFVDAFGHEKLAILGPAVGALREPDFLFAQRLAVGRARILLVGSTPSNVAVNDDQRGLVCCIVERGEGPLELVQVVRV